MSFVTSTFWFFALFVFFAYFWTPSRYRWVLMLIASYGFYAFWDWRYTPLLLGSTLIDYIAVHRMARVDSEPEKRRWLFVSLFFNLGILFIFKYWNFVGTNLSELIGSNLETHHLLLPLGISFYTFQSLAYTFDAYRGKQKPEPHLGYFALYVAFFPQLVAGPIERAQSLLPQVKKLGRASVEQFRLGLTLIVWGLFLKLVIADNMTSLINGIYFSESPMSPWLYWFIGWMVMMKVYCDFMAYSEIARGLGSLFGVKLSRNFRRPMFARTPNDYWQRWHITLTRWIGLYVNLPLARRFNTTAQKALVTIFIMTLIGLWHGASWNFILFGLYQGILMVSWKPISEYLNQFLKFGKTTRTVIAHVLLQFTFAIGSALFYLNDTAVLFSVLGQMFNFSDWAMPLNVGDLPGKFFWARAMVGVMLLVLYEIWAEYREIELVDTVAAGRSMTRRAVVLSLLMLTLFLGNFNAEDFVYFVF